MFDVREQTQARLLDYSNHTTLEDKSAWNWSTGDKSVNFRVFLPQ